MKQVIYSLCQGFLSRGMRDSIFGFAFNIAPERFNEFSYKYACAPSMELGLNDIRLRGFEPKVIFDVGAYHGDWSRMARRIWPNARIVLFEANKEKKDRLEKVAAEIGASLTIALLGAKQGTPVTYTVMESGSSVFEEESSHARLEEARVVETLESVAPFKADLLKIDVQGYELEVLRGAGKVLADASAVLLEVSLIQSNKGAPLIAEVLQFMDQHGFVTYEILEIHRRLLDRAMNQIDIFFIRKSTPLLISKSFD